MPPTTVKEALERSRKLSEGRKGMNSPDKLKKANENPSIRKVGPEEAMLREMHNKRTSEKIDLNNQTVMLKMGEDGEMVDDLENSTV